MFRYHHQMYLRASMLARHTENLVSIKEYLISQPSIYVHASWLKRIVHFFSKRLHIFWQPPIPINTHLQRIFHSIFELRLNFTTVGHVFIIICGSLQLTIIR